MDTLSLAEIQSLRGRLLAVTKNGLTESWVERIADVAREIDLPLDMIAWSSSPLVVADQVVQETGKHRRQQVLDGALRRRAGAGAGLSALQLAAKAIRYDGTGGFHKAAELVGHDIALGMLVMYLGHSYNQGNFPDADDTAERVNKTLRGAGLV